MNPGGIRIVNIPAVTMVSSGEGQFEDFRTFEQWFSQRKDFTPRDFMWHNPETNKLVWYYALPCGETPPQGFDLVDFPGGLYAVAISKDNDDTDGARVYQEIKDWVESSGCFAVDEKHGHYCMFHVVTPDAAFRAMGYRQLDIYVPIKVISNHAV